MPCYHMINRIIVKSINVCCHCIKIESISRVFHINQSISQLFSQSITPSVSQSVSQSFRGYDPYLDGLATLENESFGEVEVHFGSVVHLSFDHPSIKILVLWPRNWKMEIVIIQRLINLTHFSAIMVELFWGINPQFVRKKVMMGNKKRKIAILRWTG